MVASKALLEFTTKACHASRVAGPFCDDAVEVSLGLPGTLLHAAGADVGSDVIATWLILPVVIRSSQRLSHACLSINTLYCETANGSLYQL